MARKANKGIGLFIVILMALAACPADALVISGEEESSDFGNLSQKFTDCQQYGCGPTAAVNSFIYLQNTYPSIYDNKLVPSTSLVTEVAVANALSGLMNTTCQGAASSCGTMWENFITGKEAYIDDAALGTTSVVAQSVFAWDPADGTEPGGVQDHTAPTVNFLATQLQQKEDVEILINGPGGLDHYLTLVDTTFDTDTNTGMINYIDPIDGQLHSAPLSMGNPARGGGLIVEYTDPTATLFIAAPAAITVAVAESPIPEPASGVVLGTGLLTLLAIRRRRTIRFIAAYFLRSL